VGGGSSLPRLPLLPFELRDVRELTDTSDAAGFGRPWKGRGSPSRDSFARRRWCLAPSSPEVFGLSPLTIEEDDEDPGFFFFVDPEHRASDLSDAWWPSLIALEEREEDMDEKLLRCEGARSLGTRTGVDCGAVPGGDVSARAFPRSERDVLREEDDEEGIARSHGAGFVTRLATL